MSNISGSHGCTQGTRPCSNSAMILSVISWYRLVRSAKELVGRCRVGHGLVSAAGGRKPLSRLLHPSRTRHRPFPSNSIRWASERPRRSSHHTMSTPRRGPRGSVGALIEEVRFARDSPVEETGFEPSVPVTGPKLFRDCPVRPLRHFRHRESGSFARDRKAADRPWICCSIGASTRAAAAHAASFGCIWSPQSYSRR